MLLRPGLNSAVQPRNKKNDYHFERFHEHPLVVIIITTFIIAGYKVMFQ
jgi:hypothetical protein